ncbi:hypothetical protein HPB49_002960 [Dermacentor silvarum]|uniref:Uncharacterized protein n=1 Tax=Dermacentor silvarum TaxID=543639 RepID=A0ACB8DMA8_DERSI|nr:hypothetical protein HPB49_002960 [Dermacentor silvarum]
MCVRPPVKPYIEGAEFLIRRRAINACLNGSCAVGVISRPEKNVSSVSRCHMSFDDVGENEQGLREVKLRSLPQTTATTGDSFRCFNSSTHSSLLPRDGIADPDRDPEGAVVHPGAVPEDEPGEDPLLGFASNPEANPDPGPGLDLMGNQWQQQQQQGQQQQQNTAHKGRRPTWADRVRGGPSEVISELRPEHDPSAGKIRRLSAKMWP